jgi:hypothetical protein
METKKDIYIINFKIILQSNKFYEYGMNCKLLFTHKLKK